MITNEKVSSIYLRNLGRYRSIITALAVLFLLGSLGWLFVHMGKPAQFLSPTLYLTAMGVSVLLILDVIRRCVRISLFPVERCYLIAWGLILLGLLASGGSGPFVPLLRQMLEKQDQPLLSAPGIVSMLFYPLLSVGLLFLSGVGRWRLGMIFDSLIMMLCIVCLCWFLISQNPAMQNIETSFSQLLIRTIALSYPANDIFLLYILLPLIWREKRNALRFPFYLLAGGFVANLWAHSAVAYICLVTGRYQPGVVYIDWFWLVGFVLLGLSVLYQYSGLVRRAVEDQGKVVGQTQSLLALDEMLPRPDQELPRGWRYIRIIYIPLALVLCLLLVYVALGREVGKAGFIILCAFTVGVISLRYFYSARVNDLLVRERELRYREAERVRHLVAQFSDIRNLEILRERIVTVLLSELGFTFAMLLLVEEYDGVLTNQSRLLVSVASKSIHLTKWKLRADTDSLLFRTAISGKRAEINWAYHTLPEEIRRWWDREQVPGMVFFPILYHDEILGSLGVAREALMGRNQSDIAIIWQYTEQIAAILEHAHLYQQAREREAFARAIANISTRLNAAVIDLKEISQLICEEGANALHADHVVLYLVGEDEQLSPLATSSGVDRTVSMPQQWPSFSLSEYEGETSDPHRPFLLDVVQRRKLIVDGENKGSRVLTSGVTSNVKTHIAAERRLATLRTRLSHYLIQTVVLAPLVHGGEVLGVLLFARVTPPGASNELSFEVSDLPHAQDFVEQAGVAFANARLYGHLQTANRRLQELDQLKDQFMITASHELRTPLTAVQGYIELVAQYDDILPPEQRREFLQKARLGCEELAVLLRNVMDASRLEAEAGIKPALIAPTNVLEMIEKVKVLLDPLLTHEQREIIVDVPAYLSVLADPLRLHQVLTNISSNSLKYSLPGTPLVFSARISPDQGRSVVISISDKGKGIAPGDQAQLFQRFVRLESDLNSPIRGSGLGLYISRRLVEAMSGKIWIESRGVPGEGATFHIQLPMA
jgi:signal transduction histidine kinase